MKIDIDNIIKTLKDLNVASETIKQAVKKFEEIKKEEVQDAAESKTPKSKSQFVAIILDNEGKIIAENHTALIASVPENYDLGKLIGELKSSVAPYHETRKGKKNKIKSFSDLFGYLPRKFTKKIGVLPKCKEAVRIFAVKDNFEQEVISAQPE